MHVPRCRFQPALEFKGRANVLRYMKPCVQACIYTDELCSFACTPALPARSHRSENPCLQFPFLLVTDAQSVSQVELSRHEASSNSLPEKSIIIANPWTSGRGLTAILASNCRYLHVLRLAATHPVWSSRWAGVLPTSTRVSYLGSAASDTGAEGVDGSLQCYWVWRPDCKLRAFRVSLDIFRLCGTGTRQAHWHRWLCAKGAYAKRRSRWKRSASGSSRTRFTPFLGLSKQQRLRNLLRSEVVYI